MKIKCVGEIISEYLLANGFDGLAGDNCGCGVKDLFACDCCNFDCKPAYHIVSDCARCEVECESRGEAKDCYVSKLFPSAIRIKDGVATINNIQITPCPACQSTNIKCRGSIWNCEDCGHVW